MNEEYLRVFQAFSDKQRIRVLELLTRGEQCACVLLSELGISQPTLSYHMKILCDSGIVTFRKVGPWKYYSIDTDGCDYAKKLLETLKNKGAAAFKIMQLLGLLSFTVKSAVSTAENRACCCGTASLPAGEQAGA